jgi:hypothetical protein
VVQSTPCAPLVLTSQPTVTASANASGNAVDVDIEPNLENAAWQFTVERRTESNGWMPVGSYATRGPDETASVNLPAGSYRVVVPAQGTAREATSAVVVLTK